MNSQLESKFSKFAATGIFIVTVLIFASSVTDPVNITKLLALGVMVCALVPFLVVNFKEYTSKENRLLAITTGLFLLGLFISILFSQSPFTQNFYGTYGRNTGFITFVFFALLTSVISLFKSQKSHINIINALVLSGAVNIFYGLIVQFFGDPIPWNNIYRALLGTFGNPDFAGSFCGIIAGVYLSLLIGYKKDVKWRLIYALLLVGSIFGILETKTKQGLLVAMISIGTVLFVYVLKGIRKRTLTLAYVVASVTVGILSIFGMLQMGPLQGYLYKETVSLRGSYWNAAFTAGKTHLFTGVGLDSFGDWYRRVRSVKAATWLPGPDTITNTAHNYYLDMFASGGILLFITYLSFTVLGVLASIRILKRIEKFDFIAAAIISLFVSFQAQSLISISQIGLAIWGWTSVGLLISYSRILDKKPEESRKQKINQDSTIGVFMFIGACIGILISIPPLSADAKWMNANKSRNLANVEAALTPNYFNPASTSKYINAVLLMENSKLYPEAHKYALKAIQFNSQSFESWRALYFTTNSTANEKKLALQKMHELDPLNRNLEKLK